MITIGTIIKLRSKAAQALNALPSSAQFHQMAHKKKKIVKKRERWRES